MADEDLSHQPIQREVREKANELGRFLDEYLNGPKLPLLPTGGARKWGFALLVFKLGGPTDGDRMNYISNAERADMLVAMKEFIARAEGRHSPRSGRA